MPALNPLLVMRLIPFNNLVLFPARKKFGYEVTALRRMTIGRGFSGLAWVVVGGMQLILDGEHAFSITWQVLVSATGLELAYSQAPQSMKGALMSFWLLAVTVGNLWVLVVNASVKNAAVTNFIAATGFGVTAFQMFSSPALPSPPPWPSASAPGATAWPTTTGRRRRSATRAGPRAAAHPGVRPDHRPH